MDFGGVFGIPIFISLPAIKSPDLSLQAKKSSIFSTKFYQKIPPYVMNGPQLLVVPHLCILWKEVDFCSKYFGIPFAFEFIYSFSKLASAN